MRGTFQPTRFSKLADKCAATEFVQTLKCSQDFELYVLGKKIFSN